jgi:hypothetical protein
MNTALENTRDSAIKGNTVFNAQSYVLIKGRLKRNERA